MPRKFSSVLVTGGAGFIGCNFIRFMLGEESGFSGKIVNADCLTYAGNLESLADIQEKFGGGRYFFEKADITDRARVQEIFARHSIDAVVHFAAESHVDRSILDPEKFMRTNVMGTFTLLDCAREFWKNSDGSERDDVLFHHISTDEVYGSLGATGRFTEDTRYDPRNPYSASKAASDHIALAFHRAYGLPVTLSNCSNNYGPFQFPEKFLPLMITNIRDGKKLPVYGEGKNIRDWIHVDDHNRAVYLVMREGRAGEKYNIGGENEWQNIALLHKLIELVCARLGKDPDEARKTIVHVKDRPGHDARYAIDCSKIKSELGWKRLVPFEQGLPRTVDWYLAHGDWLDHVVSS